MRMLKLKLKQSPQISKLKNLSFSQTLFGASHCEHQFLLEALRSGWMGAEPSGTDLLPRKCGQVQPSFSRCWGWINQSRELGWGGGRTYPDPKQQKNLCARTLVQGVEIFIFGELPSHCALFCSGFGRFYSSGFLSSPPWRVAPCAGCCVCMSDVRFYIQPDFAWSDVLWVAVLSYFYQQRWAGDWMVCMNQRDQKDGHLRHLSVSRVTESISHHIWSQSCSFLAEGKYLLTQILSG